MLASLLLAGPTLAQDLRLDVAGGGLVSMASAVSAATVPTALIFVDAPISTNAHPFRVQALTVLSALPGETLDISKPETFRAVEFSLRVAQRPADSLLFSVYAEAGFATRLPGDFTPRDKTARWAGAGIAFDQNARGALSVGAGVDQRLSGQYVAAAHVRGYVALWKAGPNSDIEGGEVRLVGEAILGLDFGASVRSARRDVVRLGVTVGVTR